MNSNLFKAILAMDSYNRGYGAGIDLRIKDSNGEYIQNSDTIYTINSVKQYAKIGNSTVYDTKGDADAQAIGFYGIAYQWNGETIISYRGTDDFKGVADFLTSKDKKYGWDLGNGDTSSDQGEMAIKFYQTVAGAEANWRTANISLTGHSLGGGLAGYVGALYNKNAALYDSMTFENAAQNAYNQAREYKVVWRNLSTLKDFTSILSPEDLKTYQSDTNKQVLSYTVNDSVFKQSIYGTMNINDIPKTDLVGMSGTYIKGELLQGMLFLRSGVAELNPLDLGDSVDITSIGPFERHSMATLAIRMYADVAGFGSSPLPTDWRSAAQYFWPVMYNDAFANSIGMSKIEGQAKADGDFSGILRQIIAYSAIDEGATVDVNGKPTNACPFGDTAIRAFYNDANDLGRALGALPSPTLQNLADDISEAFIQYAGQLALSKVLEKDNSLAKDGILTLSEDESTLRVSFNEDVWKRAAGGTLPNMVAQQDLFTSISFFASPNNVLKNGIQSLMQDLWGTSSSSVFENFIFATKATGGTITIPTINNYVSEPSSKNNLFVGSNQNDIINGSNDNDLIFVGSGEDVVISNSRNDIFVSGQGNKIFSGGNITYEGLFNSTYPLSPVSITSGYLDFNGTLGGNAFIVDKGALGKDTLISMGRINLTSLNDTVVFDGYTSPARKSIVDGRDGHDVVTLNDYYYKYLFLRGPSNLDFNLGTISSNSNDSIDEIYKKFEHLSTDYMHIITDGKMGFSNNVSNSFYISAVGSVDYRVIPPKLIGVGSRMLV